MLQTRQSFNGRKIFAIGKGSSEFCASASMQGVDAAHFESSSLHPSDTMYDGCALFDVFGLTSDLVSQINAVRERLKCNGLLLITLPVLARANRDKWLTLQSERAVFFDTHNITSFLLRNGFCNVTQFPGTSDATYLCQMKNLDSLPRRLSIILPVYNEQRTLERLISSVLNKSIKNLDREIVIVESNSTDGSREIIQNYEGRPGIKIIYEEKPRGKGHAVRNGLDHISGDVILIQDADLEYDTDDYDALIEPILSGHKLFVLGSRHTGDSKMRNFEDRKLLSTVFNFGQMLCTSLINVACGTNLKDPFTMYKVFHRECLYGLKLESNRFDLDWEIVIKFIRKGFVPIELPVNYSSRSFAEGKKIRPFLDPMLWIAALIKFRWGPLYSTEKPAGRLKKDAS
jgi:hypothetical protein